MHQLLCVQYLVSIAFLVYTSLLPLRDIKHIYYFTTYHLEGSAGMEVHSQFLQMSIIIK